jgi:hypothetical protein
VRGTALICNDQMVEILLLSVIDIVHSTPYNGVPHCNVLHNGLHCITANALPYNGVP